MFCKQDTYVKIYNFSVLNFLSQGLEVLMTTLFLYILLTETCSYHSLLYKFYVLRYSDFSDVTSFPVDFN